MYQYPYGDCQQLNLDWIINKLIELEQSWQAGEMAQLEVITNAIISLTYNPNQAYNLSDIVFHEGHLYRCNTTIAAPGEAWDPSHWDQIMLGDTVANLVRAVAGMSSDDVFNDSNVSGATLTAALNGLVEDIRYNNHWIQQKKNGAYANAIEIEDTPSNSSNKLASSKALYDQFETLNSAHYATLADPSYTGSLRAQKYHKTIVISGNVIVGSTGISGQLVTIATLANQELPEPGTSSTVWGYGTYNGNIGFIQFELQANGNLRSRHGNGTITGNIIFPNATTFG